MATKPRRAKILTVLLLLSLAPIAAESAEPHPLVAAARGQVGKTLVYDPAYVSLAYPGGDVPIDRGVCTDVVIRAFRSAYVQDLQKLLHEDMTAHFALYPKDWGLKKPDRNIDHRRVQNLQTYFKRQGYALALPKKTAATPSTPAATAVAPTARPAAATADFRPGDLVTCTVPPNMQHIMIVSDRTTSAGLPLVIHNIGQGAREENRLLEFSMTGHYRVVWRKPPG